MGLKWRELPEKVLNKIDKQERPPGVLTVVEATNKKARLTELQEQGQFNNWCLLAEGRGELTYDWSPGNKATTRRIGFADFTIFPDHRPTFFIEFKLPGRRVTKEQDKKFKLLTEMGYNVFIVPTNDEAVRITRGELTKPYVS